MRILRIVVILNFVAVLLSCSSKKDKIQSVIGNPENSTDTSALAIGEVIGIGKIEPESRLLPLAAGRGGIVVKVIKGNGDHVVQGETLVILDSETEKVNADLAKARFEAQKHQLALNKNLIAEAEARMNNKKRLLESTIELVRTGAETIQNLDDLKTEVKLLEIGLENSKLNLLAAELKLSELESELNSAQLELGKRTFVSPMNGTILDMKVVQGSAIKQYDVYTEFAPDGQIIARCEIDEMFSNRVRTGQEAIITAIGSQDILATGKVVRTAPFLKRKSLFSEQPGDREDRRVREVWILLNNPKDLLFNMQVECIIKL